MPVIWQDAMSVGNILIDDEHKYLFCLINSVEIALKLDDNEKIMRMLIDQLEEYTSDHFRREEKIQIKMKYPGYVEHKLEHQEILDQIADLKLVLFPAVEKEAASPVTVATEAAAAPDKQGGAEDIEQEVEDYDPNLAVKDPEAEGDKTVAEKLAAEKKEGSPLERVDRDEVVVLLRDWILGHVLKTDMKMKRHLAQYPNNFA